MFSLDDMSYQVEEEEKGSTRKKKAKKERMDQQSSVAHKITGIDPNEPVYCLCQQVHSVACHSQTFSLLLVYHTTHHAFSDRFVRL